ncbi:hypothetical protein BXT84_00660 [Sulfobacillus thermotolerans]|uniref:Uncharacterized protein n=1 Tax=Sulfobacillus thermotolerans TaxID=338644 RepID=A0ABM6RMU3_9FIRM|nr:hypothetical protein BXT84_00660 [Sulfobacillus thermotolerans]
MSVYDLEQKCYYRPIPPRQHYSLDDVKDLVVFSRVTLTSTNRPLSKARPHIEDIAVDTAPRPIGPPLTLEEQQEFLGRIALNSVNEVFLDSFC